MKIVIAPDKFKGSLSAEEVANIIEGEIKQVYADAEVLKLPFADGGEGTSAILGEFFAAEKLQVFVHGPLMRKRKAAYYYASKKKEAYIEMANASGLQLLSHSERNGMTTNTYGTGDLIKDAIKRGAKHIVLCIGGSATIDAGNAMANALGYTFQKADGKSFIPAGGTLSEITKIIPPEMDYCERVKVTVLNDVKNPLYGPDGAAFVYGPQKGLNAEECKIVDDGLRHLAALIKKDFNFSIDQEPGAGAAGGLGGGASFFLKAQLQAGASFVSQLLQAENHIAKADWVISGEGKLDKQSIQSKVIAEVHRISRKYEKPLLLVVGKNELSKEEYQLFAHTTVLSLAEFVGSSEKAIDQAASTLRQIVRQWIEGLQ